MTRTFLFADLRDFTGFVERQGDQAAAELVAAYRALIRRKIEQSAGAEIKVEGDAMFVVFPSAREAIQCGVAILRGAASHGTAHPDSPMEIGIGLHAGEPVAQAGDFIGSAVNIAARIAAAASRGQLLISDLVRGLVRTDPPYPVRDLGAVLLKGLSEPVRVFEVIWDQAPGAESEALREGALLPAPSPPHFPGGAAPLIGRDAELGGLRDRLQALERGRGATVFIAGEAGIGKSRLLREAFFAHGAGITLYGACGLSDAPPPYEPFAGIIRSILRAPDGEIALQRIAPELLALAPETASSRQQAPDRDHLFGAVLRVLRQYARVSSPIILIEDLHWADEATLALLQFLVGQAEATPYLLVGTYRSDELHRRHRLRPVLATLARRADVSTITLGPLPEQASLQLLEALPALADAPPSEVTAINQRAEGNPLFLEELAEHHQVGRDVVPGSVAETVMERLGRAGSAATRLLRYLAVIGIRADYDLLEAVMKDEREVLDGARAAVEQHLAVEERDALVFRHALTREAVLSDLMTRERRALHREVGEALEQLHGSEADLSSTIAEHLGAAGLPQRALPYLLRAGERALRLHAPDEAARAYEQAVESAPAGSRDRMLALDGLGRAYSDQLHVGKARSTFEEALALAETVGTPEDVAGIMMRRTYTLPWGREEYAAWKACWDAAEPLGNARTLARIASGVARRAHLFFEDEQATAWLDRALSEARKSGSRDAEIRVLRNRALFQHQVGWQAEEEALIREQLDSALSRDGDVLDIYADLLARRARDSDAAERTSMLDAARAYADKRAIPADLAIRFGVPWISWLTGDWPAALALWEEIRSRHSEDAPAIYPSAGPIAAAIDLEIHGPAHAGARLTQAVAPMRATGTWRGLLNAIGHEANLHLVEGRPGAVLGAVSPILEKRPPAMLDAETFALITRAVLPATLLANDRRLLTLWTDDPVVAAGGSLHRAAIDHARAVQATINGDVTAADEAFVRAADAYVQHGWRLLAHELAWQRLKAGTATAPSAMEAANAFYREVGATWRFEWLASQ